jgi:hypothetical protein
MVRSVPQQLRLPDGLSDLSAAISAFIDEVDLGKAPMRLDLAHIHWQEPHTGGANHRRDFDILMMLYISWHLGSPSQATTKPRAKATAGRPKVVINSFEQRRNGGRLSFAVTFLLRLCTVTGRSNAYFSGRSGFLAITATIREQRP